MVVLLFIFLIIVYLWKRIHHWTISILLIKDIYIMSVVRHPQSVVHCPFPIVLCSFCPMCPSSIYNLYPSLFTITIHEKYCRQIPIAPAQSSSLVGRYLEERLDVYWSTLTKCIAIVGFSSQCVETGIQSKKKGTNLLNRLSSCLLYGWCYYISLGPEQNKILDSEHLYSLPYFIQRH